MKKIDEKRYEMSMEAHNLFMAIFAAREAEKNMNALANGHTQILLAAANGKVIRFHEEDVHSMGRSAAGARGMNVDGSRIIGMTTSNEGEKILAVTAYGYGKISEADDYRISHRGGKGVKTINITGKNGDLVAIRAVNGDEDLVIMISEGIIIRLPME